LIGICPQQTYWLDADLYQVQDGPPVRGFERWTQTFSFHISLPMRGSEKLSGSYAAAVVIILATWISALTMFILSKTQETYIERLGRSLEKGSEQLNQEGGGLLMWLEPRVALLGIVYVFSSGLVLIVVFVLNGIESHSPEAIALFAFAIVVVIAGGGLLIPLAVYYKPHICLVSDNGILQTVSKMGILHESRRMKWSEVKAVRLVRGGTGERGRWHNAFLIKGNGEEFFIVAVGWKNFGLFCEYVLNHIPNGVQADGEAKTLMVRAAFKATGKPPLTKVVHIPGTL
jgi:hypothetical protein